MKKVEVSLENRSYNILIDENLISKFPVYLEGLLNRKFLAIVTDSNVENLHLSSLLTTLNNAGIETKVLSIKAGESSKSWETLQATVDWMLDNKIERNDLVVAFGGGVVGDLVGFAAETDSLEKNAEEKLNKKNCDWIISNDVSNKNIGFNSDYNEVIIHYRKNNIKNEKLSYKKKSEISDEIVKRIINQLN